MTLRNTTWFLRSSMLLLAAIFANPSNAAIITFGQSDFVENPTFNVINTYDFSIDVAATLLPGTIYSNPPLNSVNYNVFGTLNSPTPSGFPAFNLMRTITGADFYAQGSSLNFTISAGADLSDGLQASELTGVDPIFVFNGRELGTGRYHPSLVELNANGTGLLRNSNNMGGVNPGSGNVVDVQIGDEYVVELGFTPANLTLVSAVPEPSTWALCGACMVMVVIRQRRKNRS